LVRSGCSAWQVPHQDSKKLTTAGRPRSRCRLTVRLSKAVTSTLGAGLRRAIGSSPGGDNLVWTIAFGVAAARGAAVVAGTAAGPSVGAAVQTPTATTTSKASKADRMRMAG